MNFSDSQHTSAIRESAAAKARQLNDFSIFSEKWECATDGFLNSLPIPTEFGGAGFGAYQTAASFYEIGKNSSDSGFNFSLAAHTFAGIIPILSSSTTELGKRILQAVAQQNFILANAMTEPSSGSDAFALKASAEKKGDDFILNGTKIFCTNAPIADGILVYALTDPSKGFFGGITCFLLEKKIHAYKVGPTAVKSGLKNSPMAEIFLNDVKVNKENIIGKIGGGAMLFHESMNWERACIAAMHTGTMALICERTRNYILQKESGGKTIASHQGAQFRLAEMFLRMENARLLSQKAALLIDDKKDATVAAAKAKIYASEAFQFIAQDAVQLHGANGILDEELMGYVNDAQASSIYSGPNDVLRELIAGRL
ncbi:MAG TPA: acyl-CoA dehydrogenase family protein [Bacteroidia bacterium]|jgi:alkylation response protein AidB-like acyl-CoA dehydrogenase|nr:acyl-CoA dehydrogenase family protein [Bacteroidia bacterium]